VLPGCVLDAGGCAVEEVRGRDGGAAAGAEDDGVQEGEGLVIVGVELRGALEVMAGEAGVGVGVEVERGGLPDVHEVEPEALHGGCVGCEEVGEVVEEGGGGSPEGRCEAGFAGGAGPFVVGVVEARWVCEQPFEQRVGGGEGDCGGVVGVGCGYGIGSVCRRIGGVEDRASHCAWMMRDCVE